MKIGVITFHNYDNYGAILQSYALQKKLRELGTQPEIIDYNCDYISNPFRLLNLRKKGLFNYIYGVIGHVCYLPRRRRCNLFRRRIKYGPTVTKENIAERTADYDMLLAGSDQVWDYKLTNFDRTYFLDFAKEGIRKCSYAASIGEHLPPQQYRDEYARLLKDFDEILVRESYGADVVEELTGSRPVTAVDPTLLLTGEEWSRLSRKPRSKKPYILVYQLGINPSLVDFVRKLKEKTSLPVKYVPFPLVGLLPCSCRIADGPAEWIGLFENASYVVSDSFHGIVFSLLFEKNFFAMVDGHHKNRRVAELLQEVGLSHRTIDQVSGEHLLDDIDYTEPSAALRRMRRQSLVRLRRMVLGEETRRMNSERTPAEGMGKSVAGKKKDPASCCGCSACSHVCPVGAITMESCENGFLYPEVTSSCVGCGKCRQVCPMEITMVGRSADPDVYAVQNEQPDVLRESSSGGMFSLLADWILERDGVIYGVAFDEQFHVRHMRAQTKEEADRFRTSKYVDSDISAVYDSLADDLQDGLYVLLTGTPCQISGVLRYLDAKHVDTDRLYTCDNICHGVPSREVWATYLQILKERYIGPDDTIEAINMRSKKMSWKEQVMDVRLKHGDISETVDGFSFNRFFLSLSAHRPSCFQCHYTSYARVSDFTLGDFWNVEQAGISFDTEGGVNAVLVNTDRGRELFRQIRSGAKVQKSTMKAVWQPYLEYSAKAPAKQDAFWQEYHAAASTAGKEAVMRRYMQGSALTKLIRKVSPLLRKTGLYGAAGQLYKKVILRK